MRCALSVLARRRTGTLPHANPGWYPSSFSTVPAHDWLTRTLPLLRSANRSLYECVQHAGDVLVLPDLWGHLTYNLDVSVGLAQEFEYFA